MRILITSIVDPKRSAYSRLHAFTEHLSKNHKVTILTINDSWKGFQSASKKYEEDFQRTMKDIGIVYMTEKKKSIVTQELFSKHFMKVFIARQGPFDLIIDYNTLSIGRRAQAIMQDIPRIYDLADDLADMIRISPQMNSLIAPFAARFARRMILKSVRKAQIVTGTTKPLLDKYEVPSEKGKVIHNGIPANFIEPVEQSEIIDCRKRQEEFLIGYVGVLREWVDFKPIFESIKNLQPTIPIRLIIIGEEGEKDKVIAQADKAGVLSSVSMVGTISHNKIRRYLAACDCGIVPFALTQTSEYALPLKVFEYLSAGIPVISSGIRAIKEDFADIVWLYEDEKSLRNAILEIESNKNMVKEKVNRGMEKVRVDYTWTGIMRKFDLLIEKVT